MLARTRRCCPPPGAGTEPTPDVRHRRPAAPGAAGGSACRSAGPLVRCSAGPVFRCSGSRRRCGPAGPRGRDETVAWTPLVAQPGGVAPGCRAHATLDPEHLRGDGDLFTAIRPLLSDKIAATTLRARAGAERVFGREGRPTALDRPCPYCRGPLTAFTRAAPVMVRRTGRSSRCPWPPSYPDMPTARQPWPSRPGTTAATVGRWAGCRGGRAREGPRRFRAGALTRGVRRSGTAHRRLGFGGPPSLSRRASSRRSRRGSRPAARPNGPSCPRRARRPYRRAARTARRHRCPA